MKQREIKHTRISFNDTGYYLPYYIQETLLLAKICIGWSQHVRPNRQLINKNYVARATNPHRPSSALSPNKHKTKKRDAMNSQASSSKGPLPRAVITSANGGKLRDKTTALLEHTFEDESGLEYGGTAFGDFATYMAAKQTKLQNQARVAVQEAGDDDDDNDNDDSSGNIRTLFRGCVIYINGYTGDYSSEQLQRMIIKYGGVHVNHMWGGKTTVTHIVASTLTARKREMFDRYRVVKPEWVVKCVEAGKLVPWQEYRTIENANMPGQTTLNMGPPKVPAEMPPPAVPHLQPESIPRITDPAFIKHFYEHSRLHHLSMWKAELRRKYLNIAQSSSQKTGPSLPPDTPRIIMHADFDSFFVAVALLRHPELKDKPVCVASGTHDSSDIASVNYVARQKYGLSNGMWLKRARQMCPQLTILKFDFPAYEVASQHLYDALLELEPDTLYPVSVDEAVVDVTTHVYGLLEDGENATEEEIAYVAQEKVAARLRNVVRASAGIEISVGIGNNMLLARVALAKAKPEGHLCIRWSERLNILDDGTISLRDLPGVGYSVVSRLKEELGVHSLAEMREKVTQQQLESVFGPKSGKRLWEVARGIDDTDIKECVVGALERKSIGVEISWGVRADSREEVGMFVRNLAHEVSERMQRECEEGYVGRSVTLKVYRAHKYAVPNKSKAFGHGMCDIYSKSRNVPGHLAPTDDEGVLGDLILALMDTMECPPEALRGVGIQVTKLEKKGLSKTGQGKSILRFVEAISEAPKEPREPKTPEKPKPKPLDPTEIDWSVYAGLPSTIQRIVKEEYDLPSTPEPAKPSSERTTPTKSPSKGLVRSPSKSPSKRKLGFKPPAFSAKRHAGTRHAGLAGAGQNTLTQQFGGSHASGAGDLSSAGATSAGFEFSSSQNYFARPSIIDADILKELPSSVIADIQRELKLQSASLKSGTTAAGGAAPAAAQETALRLDSGLAPLRRVLLDGRLEDPETEVYPALSCWIKTATREGGGPHPEDVNLVRQYVAQLASDPVYWALARRVVRWIKRESTDATAATSRNKLAVNPKFLENARKEWAEVVGLYESTLVQEFDVQGVPI